MDSTSPRRVFSTVEPTEVEAVEQRPVRLSVFLSLLLGMISAVAILGKPLIVFPVLTLMVALFALRPSRQGPPVAGWLAALGVLLAVFFGAWGWTRAEIRENELARQATEFAHHWLVTLAQGEKEMAMELTHPVDMRQPETMPLRPYYATEPRAKEAMGMFLEQPEIEEVIESGPGSQWTRVGTPRVTQRSGLDRVSVHWQETSQGPGKIYRTDLERIWDEQQQVGQWRLELIVESTPDA